jgi:hypothetical protein
MVELWVAQALEGKFPQGLRNHKIAQELSLKNETSVISIN